MITGRGVMAALLGCGLLGLESALFASFHAARIEGPPALGAHLALVLVTALPGFGAGGRAKRLQLAAWVALLGPFGVLIGMTLFLPKARADAGAMTDGEAEPALVRLETLRNDVVDGRLRLGGGHLIRPLLDIVIEGETIEKLDALSLVAKRYTPGFAPALQRALQDADGSVRVLAATVVAQLNDGHTRRIGALQDAAQAVQTPESWRALGEARLAYAASGLLEGDRAAAEVDEGRVCLARAGAGPAQAPAPAPERDEAVQAMAPCLAG